MFRDNVHIVIFFCFAFGLPIWAMDNNGSKSSIHRCVDECYESWEQETGGVLAVAAAKAELKRPLPR